MTRTTLHTECTVFVGHGERYVFLWRRQHVAELFRVCGRFAVNPELSFTWYDAACLTQKVRNYLQEATK